MIYLNLAHTIFFMVCRKAIVFFSVGLGFDDEHFYQDLQNEKELEKCNLCQAFTHISYILSAPSYLMIKVGPEPPKLI